MDNNSYPYNPQPPYPTGPSTNQSNPYSQPGPVWGSQSERFQPAPGYGSPAPGVSPPEFPGHGNITPSTAIASVILGTIGIPGSVFCCYVGVPCAIAGIVTGFIALSQIKKDPQLGGSGVAKSGIAASASGLLLALVINVGAFIVMHMSTP